MLKNYTKEGQKLPLYGVGPSVDRLGDHDNIIDQYGREVAA